MAGHPSRAPAAAAAPPSPGARAQPQRAPLPAQPRPAWNHRLQVPNYMGRQPQAAHMSSERGSSHSPLSHLTWHTPTPPDVQISKVDPHYRHTPTPPDLAKGAPPFRHTPPPDCPNPLYNLQQMMISERGVQPPRDPASRGEPPAASRFSPGLAFAAMATMDLSMARSPRNGGQNGETGAPISLSVRDASKINSLDSTEITKIQTTSPTFNKAGGRPRPAKKMDSILERLNSGTDGVVITPVRRGPSPHSVIVSAPHHESPGPGFGLFPQGDPVERLKETNSFPPGLQITAGAPPHRSVIRESLPADRPPSAQNRSDESSNGSTGDGGGPRRRKQSTTARYEAADGPPPAFDSEERPLPLRTVDPEHSSNEAIADAISSKEANDTDLGMKSDASKTRRKSSSEAETIDDIAAMIASTEKIPEIPKAPSNPESTSAEKVNEILMDSVKDAPQEKSSSDCVDSKDTKSLEESLCKNIEDEKADEKPPSEEHAAAKEEAETTSFVEVENELEKMFAGIEESNADDSKIESKDCAEDASKSKAQKKTGKKRSARKSIDAGAVSSDENTPKKKRKQIKKKKSLSKGKPNFDASQNDLVNKVVHKEKTRKTNQAIPKDSYDSGSNASSSKSRGPYVQIRGPRDSPLSVNIINTPIQEEDVDKPLQKIKSLLKTKTSLNIDNNFKKKSKGLHSSTLSMKYDATTTDASWICVFCKKGPHTGPNRHEGNTSLTKGKAKNMGDLFGPYIVSTDCPYYTSMMNDPRDTLFKGRPDRGTFSQSKQAQKGKRMRRDSEIIGEKSQFPNEEMYFGMTEAGPNTFEVWMHEDCAVWAPGLHLIGAKVVGLDEAVWTCCTMRCDLCQALGATVACVKRGCQRTMHVNCARAVSWSLRDDSYLVHCADHAPP